MFSLIMNHSIPLIFLVTALLLARGEYKRYLRDHGMTSEELNTILRYKIWDSGKELIYKLIVSILVCIVISLVSFREFWMNDCFHIVFLTNLLSKPTYKRLKKIFE